MVKRLCNVIDFVFEDGNRTHICISKINVAWSKDNVALNTSKLKTFTTFFNLDITVKIECPFINLLISMMLFHYWSYAWLTWINWKPRAHNPSGVEKHSPQSFEDMKKFLPILENILMTFIQNSIFKLDKIYYLTDNILSAVLFFLLLYIFLCLFN